MATPHARFDKKGRRLPDTGHGCGCRLCEETNAPRYERRVGAEEQQDAVVVAASVVPGRQAWSPLHRRVARLVRALAAQAGPPLNRRRRDLA